MSTIYIYIYIYIYTDIIPDVPDTSSESKNNIGAAFGGPKTSTSQSNTTRPFLGNCVCVCVFMSVCVCAHVPVCV